MPTPSNLATRLTRFSMSALEDGSAIAAKAHTVTQLGRNFALVSWDCSEAPDLSNTSIEDIRSYMFFLENSHYSMIFPDGALLQMSFKIHRGEICHHRLCYLPCPVAFDTDELVEDSLYDVVDRNLHSGNYDLLRYRGGIRFDYDPEAAGVEHPTSHLTLNYDDVRLPVSRTMDAATFLNFVDNNFIGNRVNMRRLALPIGTDPTRDVLAEHDRLRPHLAWHLA